MAKRSLLPLNVMELEQVKTLRASGLTYHAISKQLGRDHKTIKKACLKPEVTSEIEVIKDDLSNFFENLAKRMVLSISDEDIQRINSYQRTLSAAIAIDKMRLLRDQSTQNIALHEIIERIERKRRGRLPRERQKEAAQEGAQRITAEAERMKGGE